MVERGPEEPGVVSFRHSNLRRIPPNDNDGGTILTLGTKVKIKSPLNTRAFLIARFFIDPIKQPQAMGTRQSRRFE